MRVDVVAADPSWPNVYDRLRRRLVSATHGRVRRIEHVGSTAVPELAAKPIIDIVLTVDDPADEDVYLAAIESLGFVLRLREPDWYEHRIFRREDPAANLHVFGDDCVEVERMLRFRDRLRTSIDDRRRYEAFKRSLAGRDWSSVQDYADAKGEIVAEILSRADRPADQPDG